MKIEKVTYEINWKKFKRGHSFFIPCLNTTQTKADITNVTGRLRYKTVTKAVIEDGVRGVRVWRV